MLLTISTTHQPATDLGYLLHKNPTRLQTFELPFGKAHVFYPEATDSRCTAALLLDVDPVGLVRRPKADGGEGFGLRQYVNDRPYVASSFMSVALGQVFGTAMSGRSKERPELVDALLPIEVRITVVPCRGGEAVLRRLFEPLGYEVEAVQLPLDEQFPEWGSSRYFTVALRGQATLRNLLTHLYVLIPVLDDEKHYYVGDDEVEKLLRRGAGWLAAHPERALITDRYLRHRRPLTRAALARLSEDDAADPDEDEAGYRSEEDAVEDRLRLHTLRLGAVLAELKSIGAESVLDVGCGEGRLLQMLLDDRGFRRIVGMDVSSAGLLRAAARLHLDRLSPQQRERIDLIHGSLTYRDGRLSGFDAATVVEVIEHLEPSRLVTFERVLFESARPGAVILTTPNVEFNVMFPTLPGGTLRHRDHRFEWTRAEFHAWATRVGERFGYDVTFRSVGPEIDDVGPPTQMAVFSR